MENPSPVLNQINLHAAVPVPYAAQSELELQRGSLSLLATVSADWFVPPLLSRLEVGTWKKGGKEGGGRELMNH